LAKALGGSMNMAEIKGKDVAELFMSIEGAPKAAFNIMSILRKLFRDAFNQDIIQVVPKFPPDCTASALPEADWQWADEQTQDAIFAQLSPEDFYFQAAHGTRTGETRAVRCANRVQMKRWLANYPISRAIFPRNGARILVPQPVPYRNH